ncbi:MAG: hypothetical protein MZV70_42955 [Desulfobacterales bacterium]|nr:hypothetical protein [Desulfobacterales bacterium]
MTKIYVGNLPFTATESEVRDLFAQHGTVDSVALPTDRETGRPRGFGFVEMPQADAQQRDAGAQRLQHGRPSRCASTKRRIVRAPAAVAAVAVVRAAVAVRVAAAVRRWRRRRRRRWRWRLRRRWRRRSASLVIAPGARALSRSRPGRPGAAPGLLFCALVPARRVDRGPRLPETRRKVRR